MKDWKISQRPSRRIGKSLNVLLGGLENLTTSFPQLSIACKISGLVVFSKEFRNENAFECHFWLMSPHTEECTGQRIEG